MDWQEVAKRLPVGRNARVACPMACGDDKSCIVNHKADAYTAYCFRCGPVGFEHKGYMTLEQLAQIDEQNKLAEEQAMTLALPSDLTTNTAEWPVEARMWLYKASIYGPLITKYGIGFSPKLGRVFLPVETGGTLAYYQGRAVFSGQSPKYLNPRVATKPMFFTKGPSQQQPETKLVVCEDILSAIRVGEVTPACSILGTKADTTFLGILSGYDCVAIWLDGDSAGVLGAASIKRALALTTNVTIIQTPLDPKEYSRGEISTILKDNNHD